MVRFKNDPELMNRTSEVFTGLFALKNSVVKVFTNETYETEFIQNNRRR